MFLASSCKLNEAKLKLREKEEQLRQIGSEHLAKVNKQSEVGTSCPDENQQVNSSVSSTTAVHVSSWADIRVFVVCREQSSFSEKEKHFQDPFS